MQRFDNKYEARAHLVISLIKDKLKNADLILDLSIVENDCNDLYDAFDEDIPMFGKSEWSLDYFYAQIGYLELIFSKERIYHILEVRLYLREIGLPELQPNNQLTQMTELDLCANRIQDLHTPRLKQPLSSRRLSDSSTRYFNQRKK